MKILYYGEWLYETHVGEDIPEGDLEDANLKLNYLLYVAQMFIDKIEAEG